jgi:hypothetical protein
MTPAQIWICAAGMQQSGATWKCRYRVVLDEGAGGQDLVVSGVQRGPNDDPNLSDEELLARRQAWFESYTQQRSVVGPLSAGGYTCPCCGQRTLSERGAYEICRVCRWEDDGQDDHDRGVIRGGPNGALSLDVARAEYEAEGGVRQPHSPPTEPA